MNYVVKTGDTLSGIGSQFGVSWQSIASANGISAPWLIYAGENIEIPAGGTSGANNSNPKGGNTMNATSGQPYDFSGMLTTIINGVVLYGIFRVLMKVL